MCGINPMGGLLTSKTGRAAALGGVAGTMLASGKKKKQPAAANGAEPAMGGNSAIGVIS